MLNGIMLSFFMLSVLMLNVIVLSAVAPAWRKQKVNVLQTSFMALAC
jgi:uncharacterized membrane protein YqjE